MPRIGFGTYNTSDDEACRVVCDAVEVGYRLIDTAAIYENEAGIGRALATCGVPREELFITSKVWNTHRGYAKTMESFNASCERLGVDYLDFFLIHWPANEKQFGAEAEAINADTWRALEDLYKNGAVRSDRAFELQTASHRNALEACRDRPRGRIRSSSILGAFKQKRSSTALERDLVVEAWSPLGRGKTLTNEAIAEIGARYGKSNAQVCLRWLIQLGMLPLPKSGNIVRMKQNLEVFDFELTPEEMAVISAQENPTGRFWDADEIDF